jgi:RNA polymerase sigma-70 factor (ECF subfamily)
VGSGRRDAGLAAALCQAQNGDRDAFLLLYRDIQPRLLRHLRALAGGDAEDVASETWLHVTRDLDRFRGDYDGFRSWVATIGRHRALDHARRAARRPATPAGDLTALPAAEDTAALALEAIGTAWAVAVIARLPPDQAAAVLLRAVLGLDARTAGLLLGKQPGAVRTAAYRGLHTLQTGVLPDRAA